MTLQIVFWIVAAILMAVSAFVQSAPIALDKLAWAFFIAGFAIGGLKIE